VPLSVSSVLKVSYFVIVYSGFSTLATTLIAHCCVRLERVVELQLLCNDSVKLEH
jgi:hypothetical protein